MIELKGVTKRYEHNVMALDNVNLKIDKGEFVFLAGPSGSGKSTFLKLLLKEELPSNGTVYINGTQNQFFFLKMVLDFLLMYSNLFHLYKQFRL